MKIRVLLATALFTGTVFAQDTSAPWPMPSPLPSVPAGVNSATYPMPRVEWFKRVLENNQNAQNIASTIALVFDGDSITDGWQGAGRPVWAERYGKLHAFDFGLGGDRTESILWRLYQGQMNGIQPKLIALMIGTNNLGSNSPEQIAEGVKAVVADYQKRCPGAVILLQAIFPRGEKPTDPLRAKIKATNQIISQLGDGKKVIYVDFGDKFLQPDGTLTREIMPDFLHPSAKGYQIWADAIHPTISQFFPTATTGFALPANIGPNLALNKKYVCSAPNPSGWDGGLVDGSWEENAAHTFATDSADTFPKTVTIDLEKTADVSAVVVGVPGFGSTKTITVSISPDNTNFTEVGSYVFTQSNTEKHLYSFPAKAARYVRLTYPDHYDTVDRFTKTYVFTTEAEVYAPGK